MLEMIRSEETQKGKHEIWRSLPMKKGFLKKKLKETPGIAQIVQNTST